MVGNRTILAVTIATLAVVGAVAAVGLTGSERPTSEGIPDGGNATQPAAAGAGAEDTAVAVEGANKVDWVRDDGSMTVSVALEADDPVTRTVSLRVDEDNDGELDRTVAEQETRLSPSATEVSFEVPAADLPAGEHEYGVVAGGETSMLGTTTVVETPAFELTDVPASATTVAGTPTNVSLAVENAGDYGATRTVTVGIDADRSGSVDGDEPTRKTSVTLGQGERRSLSVSLPAGSLDPGNYTYRLSVATDAEDDRVTDDVTARGTLEVLEPARFSVTGAPGPAANVTRGTPATIEAMVTNTGEAQGTTTVVLRGPTGTAVAERDVTLSGGMGTDVSFDLSTEDRDRGTYDYTVTAGDGEAPAPVRVREGVLEVSDLRGNETLIVGDPMVFEATVTNTGGANATGEARLRIDLDDDDRTEYDGISKNVTLAPGNDTTVRFDVPYMEDPDPLNQVEDLPTGTYIYGVFTDDDNETSVFDARSKPTSFDPFAAGGSGSSGDGTADGDDGETLEQASRDELSQAKYGLDYGELSGETKSQLDELYLRQPFAGDLGVTDVLTREEIARQEYGLDVRRGDNFEFRSLDTDLQQQIEADFDAQFTSESGDRIESWAELAIEEYGAPYGDLTPEQQEAVREAYRAQFE